MPTNDRIEAEAARDLARTFTLRVDHLAGRSRTERVLVGLEVLLAVGAVGGAVGLIGGGIDLGDSRDRLPFGSAAFGGWALLAVNGLLPTAVAIAAVRRHPLAPLGHLVVGAALTAWVVVQVGFLGWPPVALQWIYFAYGLAIVALSVQHRRQVSRR